MNPNEQKIEDLKKHFNIKFFSNIFRTLQANWMKPDTNFNIFNRLILSCE